MVRVTVEIPGRHYDVVIGDGLLARAADHLPPRAASEKAFVVADQDVAARYLAPLAGSLSDAGWQAVHLGVPPGEEAKSLQTLDALYQLLATKEAHRDDLVVALGGGATGDLTGFLAATYMRGLPLVQVPTTLTAQVDAAIGGKTAVNLPEGKNLVGAFHQPVVVLADVATLATLEERDFRSGLAEVVKYALTLDLGLLELLERDPGPLLARDATALEDVVERSVRAKAAVVARDERDAAERLVLNYGHTLGHALERIDAYAGRSHGEAIAVGMVFAARLAEALEVATAGIAARHVRLLKSLGLDPDATLPASDAIVAAMRIDKKYRTGLRFVLLEDVGRPRVVDPVPEDVVVSILKELGAEG